ncbi:hypothetical protein [Pseudoxanthomonas winnipegensis]|uniref:Uncharacterized protein n=1 Tax=Pseudoxanthomonas winnipegensis TaxID=2480810 RepID=A0A4Q8M2K1_9GAMM|nr:hypothetical protein [Pseudoxanthomonas winnipegensis]TAA41543.1 hypothetical protein EA655_11415 [Pseudoxanthomonas winnipegensis]
MMQMPIPVIDLFSDFHYTKVVKKPDGTPIHVPFAYIDRIQWNVRAGLMHDAINWITTNPLPKPTDRNRTAWEHIRIFREVADFLAHKGVFDITVDETIALIPALSAAKNEADFIEAATAMRLKTQLCGTLTDAIDVAKSRKRKM